MSDLRFKAEHAATVALLAVGSRLRGNDDRLVDHFIVMGRNLPTPPASQESAGEAVNLESLLETYWCCAFTEGAEGRVRDNVAGEAQQTLSAIRALFATLTAQLAEAREQRDSLRDECERLREALRSAKINAVHAASQLSYVKHEKDLLRCAVKHIAEADTSNKRVTVGALIHITQEALFDDAARQSHRENNEMAELAALSASGQGDAAPAIAKQENGHD